MQYKPRRNPMRRPNRADGSSPIAGYAIIAYFLGDSCASYTINENGNLVVAPTGYTAIAVQTCFNSGPGQYFMFEYTQLALGQPGFNIFYFTDSSCTVSDESSPTGNLPVSSCYKDSSYALQVMYFAGSKLPTIPVTAPQYTVYM